MSEPRKQYAALPYRRGETVEILLVTSLDTGRWIVPKGWPMKGLTAPETAACEAFEEAGVTGAIAGEPIGAFLYDKRRKGGVVPVRVEVFPLAVVEEHEAWPERDLRQRRWTSAEEAAAAVSDAGLGDLIRAFAHRLAGNEATQA